MRGLILLFLLLSPLLVPSRSFAQAPGLAVLVNVMMKDPRGTDLVEAEERKVLGSLHRLSPDSRYAVLRVETNEEARAEIEKLIRSHPDLGVDVLFLQSHGNSRMIDGAPVAVVGNESANFVVDDLGAPFDPNHTLEVTFAPLLGRFNPNAKIIFDGCLTAATGTLEQKFRMMQNIAKQFDMQSGSIYLNAEVGQFITNDIWSSSATHQGTFARDAEMGLLKLLSPITLPIGYVWENTRANNGYSLYFDRTGSALYADSIFRAMGTKGPRGQALLGEANVAQ